MKKNLWFLFTFILLSAYSQEDGLGTVYFRYDNKGLHPKEYTFKKDSLTATEIYRVVKASLEDTNKFLAEFKGKVTKETPNESFTFKGEFGKVFCLKGIVGPSCKDASFEIDFIFRDGSYTMKPIKLKRISDIEYFPIEGKAIFYKKDGSLKSQFITFPAVVETMLNWIAHFSNYSSNTEETQNK